MGGEGTVARHESIQLVDDLDGSTGDVTTVEFGLDGVEYEIDLSDPNAARLRRLVAEYVRGGRWVGGKKLRIQHSVAEPVLTLPPKTAARPPVAGQVREWALANGIAVAPRGRIPKNVVDKYQAAQQQPRPQARKR